MPESCGCAAMYCATHAALCLFSRRMTSKYRFGRSNPVTVTNGSRRPSSVTMSRRTRSVAVAVKAATAGRCGRDAMNSPMPRYAERKSCPHWETQCASSTAMSAIGTCAANRRNRSVSKRSGATYSSLTCPAAAWASTMPCSSGSCVVLMYAELRPASFRASTWSRISEISGEMTMVTPGSNAAGIW